MAEAVEPHHIHLPVFCEKLGELGLEVLVVPCIITYSVIGVMPIPRRIIESEMHPRLMAGVSQFFDDIPFEWGMHNGVVTNLRIPHAKSAMMLSREHDIVHTGVFRELHPRGRVKLFRI